MKPNIEDVLVNPYTAIRLFARTYKHFGEELVFKDRRFKITREAWIASMFLLALKNHLNQDWYFRPETKDGSPDFYCYTFIEDKAKKGNIRPQIKLEVFEWRKEDTEEDFLEALKRIKLNKIIDPQITIICYVRRYSVMQSLELNEKLKGISPRVKDIWFLGDITPDSKMWRVSQIYPNILSIDMDYDEILATKEKHSFIHSYRGLSEKMEYEPTERKVHLTPEFELKFEE